MVTEGNTDILGFCRNQISIRIASVNSCCSNPTSVIAVVSGERALEGAEYQLYNFLKILQFEVV
jgi:hypothetical protein